MQHPAELHRQPTVHLLDGDPEPAGDGLLDAERAPDPGDPDAEPLSEGIALLVHLGGQALGLLQPKREVPALAAIDAGERLGPELCSVNLD